MVPRRSLITVLLAIGLAGAAGLTSASFGPAANENSLVEHLQHRAVSAVEHCEFNGFHGKCRPVASCRGTSVSNSTCGATPESQCCIEQKEVAPGCGTAAIARAMTWVNMQILYCQSPNGQPDADTDCDPVSGAVCERYANPAWDAYRSDCSGFVSYAYGYPAPGRDTRNFAPYQSDVTFPIRYTDLRMGDAVNSIPDEHMMLFHRWLTNDYSAAEFLEEPACQADPPYARVMQSAVNITEAGLIGVESNGMYFLPIRFKTNQPPC